jgi:hypothetical protein
MTDNVLSIDFGDATKQYQCHDPERLLDIVGIGGEVQVCESYSIVRFRHSASGSYCFSILDAEKPWSPCDYQPLRATTPEALAERIETHGGFSVPGHQILRGST